MEPVKAKIHGVIYTFPSHRELARFLLMNLVDDENASFDSRLTNLVSVMDFLGMKKKAQGLSKTKNFVKAYWDTILYLDGMDTLRGFTVGCSIEKGDSNYNPEKRRISTDWTLLEED